MDFTPVVKKYIVFYFVSYLYMVMLLEPLRSVSICSVHASLNRDNF